MKGELMRRASLCVSWKFLAIGFASLLIAGCASMFMKGGTLTSADYTPEKVLVSYRAEGTVPPNTKYLLVQTVKGEAIYEKSSDSGALFETCWKDAKGQHFAGWVATSHGYEFVVPEDRTKPAKKFVYPKGFYSIETVDAIARPVPIPGIDPVATLIPE